MGLVTVVAVMVTPAPRLAMVWPWVQAVYWPSTARVTSICCWPVVGLEESSTGVPGFTIKPPASEAFSPCVLRVTVCGPVAASGAMEMFAVASVALLTVRLLTVMPEPKFAVVTP